MDSREPVGGSHHTAHDSISAAGDPSALLVLVPVYNDWEAVSLLLDRLDQALEGLGMPVEVLLVDDGSTEPAEGRLRLESLAGRSIRRVDVLELRRNLGHQRALAIGLCHVEANRPCRAVAIMDGDGEDAPEDVPRLVEAMDRHHDRVIVFAERTKRSESLLFRVFYKAYRTAHLLLTGIPVRIGNFSVMPASMLRRLVVVSDLWNHYAASVVKSRIPMVTLPTARATRLAGRSRMNFVSLVTHGLSAISVFGDRVGVRLLIAASGLLGLVVLLLLTTLVLRVATPLAIPDWAQTAAGLLVLISMQLLMLSVVFVLVVLGGRDSSSFLPARDYHYFVSSEVPVYQSDGKLQLRR